MKSTEQYVHVVLARKKATFRDDTKGFPSFIRSVVLFVILCNMILTFESVG